MTGFRAGLRFGGTAALLATALVLAGCSSSRRPEIAEAPPPPALPVLPAAPAAPGAMPINRGLGSGEMLWHLRAALNVAALACLDAPHAAIAAQYNLMLDRHKAPLAVAHDEEEAHFRQLYGTTWQAEFDRHQTKLYNMFADPRATAGLCDQAMSVAAQVNGAESTQLAGLAGEALARVEQPFLKTMPLALNVGLPGR